MGRHKDCDQRFIFSDKRVSAKHCRIVKESAEVFLYIFLLCFFLSQSSQDNHMKIFVSDNSSNGTYINGKKLGKGVKVYL